MGVQDRLNQLRELLHQRPSARLWRHLCALLDGWPMNESARLIEMSYVLDHLERWPDELRVSPPEWSRALLRTSRYSATASPHHAWSMVRSLRFDRVDLPLELARTLASSPHLRQITHLHLETTTLNDAGVLALLDTPNLAALRALVLINNPIGEKGIAELAFLESMGSLTHLSVLDSRRRYRLDDDGARALVARCRLMGLTHLDLGGQRLGPEGVWTLVGMPAIARLKGLGLGSNGLGIKGARVLSSAHRLAKLESLDLRYNSLGDEGAAILASSPYLGGLRSLDLSANGMGAKGWEMMARSERLSEPVRASARRSLEAVRAL